MSITHLVRDKHYSHINTTDKTFLFTEFINNQGSKAATGELQIDGSSCLVAQLSHEFIYCMYTGNSYSTLFMYILLHFTLSSLCTVLCYYFIKQLHVPQYVSVIESIYVTLT